MSFDGVWNIEIASPMGAQKATLTLKATGGVLSGTQAAPQGSAPIEDGKVDGDHATWSANVSSPMPMKLDFDVTRNGDALSGAVKAGSFGSFPVKGARG